MMDDLCVKEVSCERSTSFLGERHASFAMLLLPSTSVDSQSCASDGIEVGCGLLCADNRFIFAVLKICDWAEGCFVSFEL